mgnify:CR=1 FL=1
MVEPVVSLASSISWAFAISDKWNSWPISKLILPSLTFFFQQPLLHLSVTHFFFAYFYYQKIPESAMNFW